MKPAPFIYDRPATLEAALALLARAGDETKILAGGQSLVPMMNFRVAQPRRLVDINRLPNLDYIRRDGEDLVIGALARHAQVKSSPIVRAYAPIITAAYDWVAHGPVRNRGTLAGNLCHADPASEMPSLMLALNATLVLRSASSERCIDAASFFKGIYATAVEPHEMLVETRIPICSGSQGWGFHEVSLRKGDFAFACVAALMTVTAGVIATVAIGAAGIADRPLRLSEAEKALVGKAPSASMFSEAANAAAARIQIVGDARAPAEYRRDLVAVLARRALLDASGKAQC